MTRLWLLAALAVLGCGGKVGPDSGSGGSACTGPHWTRVPPPAGAGDRGAHSAEAWGSDQIAIWGGRGDSDPHTGASTPLVSGWHVRSNGEVLPIPTAGAPSPRSGAAFAVLGDRLFSWGGMDPGGTEYLTDGFQLDLGTGVWSPMSTQGQLAPRHSPVTGRAGSSLLLWGGYGGDATKTPSGVFPDGALYDPETGVWNKLDGEPLELRVGPYQNPVAQAGEHVAALANSDSSVELHYFLPSEQRWVGASTAGAPSSRSGAVLVYLAATGELFVWSGSSDGGGPTSNDGARYSLSADSWQPVSTAGAPSARSLAYGVALTTPEAGTKVVVWGGEPTGQLEPTNTGGIYDVATDTWAPLPLDECSPPPLYGAAATFTAFGNGRQALLWGGASPDEPGMREQGWVFTLEP